MDVRLASGEVATEVADATVVLAFETDESDDPSVLLDGGLGGRLARARARHEFGGKLYDVASVDVGDALASGRILLIGLGKRAELRAERVRRAGGAVARQLRRRRVSRAQVVLPAALPAGLVEALVDGIIVGDLERGLYRKRESDERGIAEVAFHVAAGGPPDGWAAAVETGRILGESANVARALALEPGNRLTPRRLADRAVAVASEVGLEHEVLDEEGLRGLGAGALLGVAQGSEEPPRMIVLRHRATRPGGPTFGVVGKGVTFDSGGISIKPAERMAEMKYDMAGAAATVGALRAIALLRLDLDVVGIIPTTENLLGGRAMRPGDVLTAMDGTTIEVLNTDAEGRLILADALVYARQLGASHLIDAATLTGAIVSALGHHASGLFGTPESWLERVRAAAERAGDRAWTMPLFPEYREQLKSEVADIANVGGRPGGAGTAATFLREFVGDVPWAHLDIAGTAYTTSDRPYLGAGPTAAGMRIFVELARDMAAERAAAGA